MMIPVIVSPAVRFDVNAPAFDVPVLDSVLADTAATVRCLLPVARPETVWLLVSFTTLFLLSRRVAVPVTNAVVTTVFVVLSRFDCATPAAVVYLFVRVTMRPSRVVVGPQVTMPVVAE